ncbi:MAG: hypothetical protein Q7U16_19740 [Agitococcus sp.]|nr:hypothetical protein [Agitococcus sp.]
MCEQEIKNALVNGLLFLTDFSNVFSEFSVSESQASGRFYSVTYTSTTYRRKVNTTFLPKSASIRCSLINVEDDFCFFDAGSMALEIPEFGDAKVESIEELVQFFVCFDRELQKNYSSALMGGAFENDKFNWSPYK